MNAAAATVVRRVYPPHYVLLAIGAEVALHFLFPVYQYRSLPSLIAGAVVLAGGILVGGSAARLFARAKTGIVPFSPSTKLVESGAYRYTRNPMYLGMALGLTGIALLLGTLTPLAAPVAFVIVIHYRFIRPEEQHLLDAFGDDYRALQKRVRRWL